LDAGKHVICEKPVARSLQEVDEIMAAEKQSGKHVMPIFQYRFGCGLQKLKRLVSDGVAGRAHLTTVETAWRRRANYYATWHGKWKMELGGAMLTLAVHAHDALYYILGPSQSVFARTATRVNPIETEDCVSASLEMADGSLCSLSVTTGSTHQISRHRFCFSHLTAESNTRPYANTSDPWTFTGDSPEIDQHPGYVDPSSHFRRFRRQFYRFHRHPSPSRHRRALATLADARAAPELITAVFSARTEQVVCLPIDSSSYYTGWLR
jgi:predicted dehydrogenase